MRTIFLLPIAISLMGCAGGNQPCESIEEVQAQERYCEDLRKKLNSTTRLQIRSALNEQYQNECVDFRYYRDSFDDQSICTLKQKEELAQQGKQ